MIEPAPASPLYQRNIWVGATILIVVALAASLIECRIVLAIQARIHPHYSTYDAQTVPLGSAAIGNAFAFHAALNGTEIDNDQDSQLIIGITNTLADKRYVATSPWALLSLRVVDAAGMESVWPVLGGIVAPTGAIPAPLPEMVDPLDVASLQAGTASIQFPHEEDIFTVHFLKLPPSWTTFRERSGVYHVLSKPGRYRLQIIYAAPEGPRVLSDYADLWVK